MSDSTDPLRLSPEDELTLASVLDEIVPPSAERKLPGAGEIGLVGAIVDAAKQNPALGPIVLRGIQALDELARNRRGHVFRALRPEERSALFRELAAMDEGFVPSLTFPLYVAYYQHARVLEALGMEARPPHPKGYEIEPFDPILLEPVRRRPKLYREV